MYLPKAPNCAVYWVQDGASSPHAIIRLSVAASLARAPAGGLLVAGLRYKLHTCLTRKLYSHWYMDTAMRPAWVVPIFEVCSMAYIANLLYSYYFLPLKLIITEFINTFIFCVLKCLYYLLLHRLPQLSTHTLNTRA